MSAGSMRLRALVRKEWLQILRDPSSLGVAFVLPLVLLVIFGYGVSLDAREVPLALVVEQPDAETARFVAGFAHSEYFVPVPMRTIQQAERALAHRQVRGIVWLRRDFARDLLAAGEAPVSVIVNGVDANTARLVEGYVQGVWVRYLERYATARGRALTTPARLDERVWFNPEVRSRDFLVPGLIAIIMTLIGALLTAMVVAREWERGTMEALLVTPLRAIELLAGKLIPYFVLGMGGMLFTVAVALTLFAVPLRGSFWVLFAASAAFMLVALGMGLTISVVARSQFVAGQIAIIVTFLPAFILSGFVFDIGSMPAVIQLITHVVPARYFVAILQTVFLAGDVWSVIGPNLLALAGFAVLFALLLARRTGKRLA